MRETDRSLDQVFITAARCADCPNPPCAQSCPEHIDLHALFEFIAAQAPMPLAWKRKMDDAEAFAGDAIHNSYS